MRVEAESVLDSAIQTLCGVFRSPKGRFDSKTVQISKSFIEFKLAYFWKVEWGGVGWGGVGWGGVGDSGAWSWASSMRCHLELDGWMDGQTGRQINRQADR